jgi:signal transduction histidine kinase
MITDLMDLPRTRFGDPIPITRVPMDLVRVCAEVVSELSPQHAGGIRFTEAPPIVGQWDADRISQLVSNLVRNAAEHGVANEPIEVRARERRRRRDRRGPQRGRDPRGHARAHLRADARAHVGRAQERARALKSRSKS